METSLATLSRPLKKRKGVHREIVFKMRESWGCWQAEDESQLRVKKVQRKEGEKSDEEKNTEWMGENVTGKIKCIGIKFCFPNYLILIMKLIINN